MTCKCKWLVNDTKRYGEEAWARSMAKRWVIKNAMRVPCRRSLSANSCEQMQKVWVETARAGMKGVRQRAVSADAVQGFLFGQTSCRKRSSGFTQGKCSFQWRDLMSRVHAYESNVKIFDLFLLKNKIKQDRIKYIKYSITRFLRI